MLQKKCILYFAAILIAFLIFPFQGIVSSQEQDLSLMSVVELDGELYVKLDSLLQHKDQEEMAEQAYASYADYHEQRISQVIQQASPAVVAIVGKGKGVNTANRFSFAHGTGVIIDASGWILTNAHVIQDLQQLTVIMTDGKKHAIQRTLIDEESDLALLKIKETELPILTFSTEQPTVGETVVAIGTPISFSLKNSATSGIVSGTDRSINASYRLLQTDAAINPGNSGGPLMNLKGEVIGINTLKFAASGIESLGFAIPAETVQYVIDHLLEYGKVKRPYAGLEMEESWEAVVGLPSKEPLTISKVVPNSPADKAGILTGDILYSIDDQAVRTLIDFNELLKSYIPGEHASFMMLTQGDLVKRTITFGEKQ